MQHVVVALLVAEVLQREVGDHLVRVHVGRGAGAALDHVDHELLVQRAGDQVVAGAHDRVGALRASSAPSSALARAAAFLTKAERADQVGHAPRSAVPEIGKFSTARARVHAPVGVGGNLLLAEEVVLDASGRYDVLGSRGREL